MIAAIQYWAEDEAQALTLARLLADIEPSKREDFMLVLARRGDCPISEEAGRTRDYCTEKFQTMLLRSPREEVGYPDGCFGLWAGTLERLSTLWLDGNIPWEWGRTVFFCEADGAPICSDWIDRMRVAHALTRSIGLQVTGAVMEEHGAHVNGNLILDLRIKGEHPSLMECPTRVAWDLHHADLLVGLTRASVIIRNEHGTRNWTADTLAPIGRASAWVANVKDDSVLRYARWALKTLWRT